MSLTKAVLYLNVIANSQELIYGNVLNRVALQPTKLASNKKTSVDSYSIRGFRPKVCLLYEAIGLLPPTE